MRTIYAILLLTFCLTGYSQIGGITGSKINAINHEPIPKGKAEFEPSYTYGRTTQIWDDKKQLNYIFGSPDSLLIGAAMNFRMAYAFSNSFELGCNLGVGYSNWSMKYKLFDIDDLGIGIMGGINMPFGSAVVDKRQRYTGEVSSFAFGGIVSYEFNEQSSIDFNVQFQDYFHKAIGNSEYDVFLALDYGQYFNDYLMVHSLFYQSSNFNPLWQKKLTYSPGLSMEMKAEYMVVFNLNIDLIGRNVFRTNGFSVAFTITL